MTGTRDSVPALLARVEELEGALLQIVLAHEDPTRDDNLVRSAIEAAEDVLEARA